MSAYSAYPKMGYGAQGGDDSGGFLAGGSQQGSQGGSKSYQDETLRPVTIKQVIDSEEAYSGAEFKIDGTTVTQITFVGQVRNVRPQATNITFKIDDGTGQIEAKKFVDPEKQDDASQNYETDSYVRVWGRIRSFNGKRNVAAHVIRPVEDFNEVNYHLLEATYVHLSNTRGSAGTGGGGANTNGDSMFVDDGYNANAGGAQLPSKLSSCTPSAKKVYNHLHNTPGGSDGIHLNALTTSLGLSMRDVLAAADELLGQGLIYPTVDDETWAILDY